MQVYIFERSMTLCGQNNYLNSQNNMFVKLCHLNEVKYFGSGFFISVLHIFNN